jgi:hypothetical protein
MRASRLMAGFVAAGTAAAIASAPTADASPHGADASKQGVIVWTTRADDGSEHLLIARGDGTHQRELTPSMPDTFDFDAQVAPRGTWVAYERDTPETATIRLVRPSGAGDHVVDVGCADPCAAVVGPTWLSNKRLAFTKVIGPFDDVTGNAAAAVLFSSRLDGSDVRRLSPAGIDGAFEDGYLHVAPGRGYLTFMRRRNADGHTALFRMDLDGSDQRQLTPWAVSAEGNDLSTARSGPTKDLMVFESYGRGDRDLTFVDIATVPTTCRTLAACTARIRWITDNAATGRRNANPQWSPDGSSLVFTDRPSIDDPNAQIWTMRFGGGPRRLISTSPNFDYRPTWGRIPG